MRRTLAVLAFLALVCPSLGQDATRPAVPTAVTGRPSASVGVVGDAPTPLMGLAPTGQYVLTLPPSAVVTLTPGRIVVDLNGPAPQPQPTPTPTPVPPSPTPTPTPTPQVKVSRVMVVFDPLAALPAGQTAISLSSDVRKWLDAACDKSDDGRPAYRFWTADIDTSDESADWRAAWDTVKADVQAGGLPKVYVFDAAGKVRQTPLPATPNDFLAKLKSINGG